MLAVALAMARISSQAAELPMVLPGGGQDVPSSLAKEREAERQALQKAGFKRWSDGAVDPGEFAWSPDGTRLAVSACVSECKKTGCPCDYRAILVIRPGEKAWTQLTNAKRKHRDKYRSDSPAWSPDGRKIVFVEHSSGKPSLQVVELPDGKPKPFLKDDPWWPSNPCWSPDGRWVAFEATGGKSRKIFIAAADGSTASAVPGESYAGNPSWSPDGARIAFESHHINNLDIAIMNRDGSGFKRLTDAPTHEVSPAWSPDGKWIAFSRERSGKTDIFLLRPDGTGERQLTDTPNDSEMGPAWSPDGRWLAFRAGPEGGVIDFREMTGIDSEVRSVASGAAGGAGTGQVAGRAWIGAVTKALTPEIAQGLGLAGDGVVVTGVFPGSPARGALKLLDVIEEVNGAAPPKGGFWGTVEAASATDPVRLKVRRGGETLELPLTPAAAPDSDWTQLEQPAPGAEPRTWVVAQDGSGEARSFREAQAKARAGDTVLFRAGDYRGDGCLYLTKPLKLKAQPPRKAKVACVETLASGLKGASIEGLAVTGSPGAGISLLHAEGVKISGCLVTGSKGSGIRVNVSKKVSLQDNELRENSAGLEALSSNVRAERNLILDSREGSLYLSFASKVHFANNTVFNSRRIAKGITTVGGLEAVMRNNIFSGHEQWINVNLAASPKSAKEVLDKATRYWMMGEWARMPRNINLGEDAKAELLAEAGLSESEYLQTYDQWMTNPTASGRVRGLADRMYARSKALESQARAAQAEIDQGAAASVKFEHNDVYDFGGPSLDAVSKTNFSADPMFADPFEDDYHLDAGSPLLLKGAGGTYVGALGAKGQQVGEGEFQ